MKEGTFDFRNENTNIIEKQIVELEKVISYEKENIEMCFENAEMNGKCLDAGCGPGTTSQIISMIPDIDYVIGIDYNDYFLSYARNANINPNKIEYLTADCYHLPFPDDYFDCCYARYLFQHLKNPKNALKELIRVVRTGGIVGVHDIDYDLVIHAPQLKYADKIKKINTMLKAFHGSDMHIGKNMKIYFESTGNFEKIKRLETITNNRKYPQFIQLFLNTSNNDEEFLVNSGLFSEAEYVLYLNEVKKFIASDASLFQIGNYFTYGKVKK